MPLRLNLHHEIERAHAQRKRDPLKISIFILIGVIALFVALYATALAKFAIVDSEYKAKKKEFDSAEPIAQRAAEKEASLQKTVTSGKGLVQRIEGRFYWSSILAEVANTVPREIQVIKLDGRVEGAAIKKVSINIDGIAAGTDPRKVAEDLRLSLVENLGKKYQNVTGAFRQLEESPDHAKLDEKDWPTATFGITIQLQHGQLPATPIPRAARKR